MARYMAKVGSDASQMQCCSVSVSEKQLRHPADLCSRLWLCCRALDTLLQQTPVQARACIHAIAIAGTTTTSLLVDRHTGNLLADPILYNQPQDAAVVKAAQVGAWSQR